jgi:hypothetical protein
MAQKRKGLNVKNKMVLSLMVNVSQNNKNVKINEKNGKIELV